MTEEEWNKKWPMSKIPDSIREVVVAWSGHLFIKDKVKFAQDLLEATEKYRLLYTKSQCIEFTEWRDGMYCPYTQMGNGMWAHTELEEEPNLTTGQLYDLFIEHQKQNPTP